MKIFEQDYYSYLIDVLNLFTDNYYSGLKDTNVRDSKYTLNDFQEIFIFETSQELFDSVTNIYHSNI